MQMDRRRNVASASSIWDDSKDNDKPQSCGIGLAWYRTSWPHGEPGLLPTKGEDGTITYCMVNVPKAQWCLPAQCHSW